MTLDLPAAALLLGLHPKTLAARARAGSVPGTKLGRSWRFIESDLLAYMRKQYTKEPVWLPNFDSSAKRGGQTFITRVRPDFDTFEAHF